MSGERRILLGEQKLFSLDAAAAVTEQLLALLERYGVLPTPGSSIERMTYSIYDVIYRRQADFISQATDPRELLNDLSALAELALYLTRVQGQAEFETLVPHLRLLNEGEAGQTRASPTTDQAANKIFELITACLAMRCGVDVELEAPDNGKGGNPDVLATIRGRRWGIACKVLHSSNPQTIIDNIETGIDQIEKSPANTGLVFLSLKNVIKRERYWTVTNEEKWRNGESPDLSAFDSAEAMQLALQQELNEFSTVLQNHAGTDHLKNLFARKKAAPGVLLHAHVIAGVKLSDGSAIPVAQKWPTWIKLGELSDDLDAVLTCFHNVLHEVP